MTIAIDPQLSVYRLVERVQVGSSLLNHRRTMSLVSYEIENATLIHGARNRIFAGFQYMSKFTRQISRYTNMAMKAESVYVFGVMDVRPPALPNVIYVPLERTDQLAKEWFLVSYGRDFFSALATEEVSRITDPDHLRVFKGLWTFDLSMVTILESWLTSTVDAKPLTIAETDHDYRQQIKLMGQTMARLTTRLTAPPKDTREKSEDHPAEIGALIQTSIKPALDTAQSSDS